MKSSEMHAFSTKWNAPIRIRSIQLEKELAMRQLFNLIHSQRYRAGIWIDALLDERVDANSKSMIWIIFRLPWCQLVNNNKPRDATRVWASLHHRCA